MHLICATQKGALIFIPAIFNIDVKVMPPSVESFLTRLDALQLDDEK